jgi:hypothetical protein
VKDCLAVEEAYERYNMELAVGKAVNPRVVVDSKTEVNVQNHSRLKYISELFCLLCTLKMKTK